MAFHISIIHKERTYLAESLAKQKPICNLITYILIIFRQMNKNHSYDAIYEKIPYNKSS